MQEHKTHSKTKPRKINVVRVQVRTVPYWLPPQTTWLQRINQSRRQVRQYSQSKELLLQQLLRILILGDFRNSFQVSARTKMTVLWRPIKHLPVLPAQHVIREPLLQIVAQLKIVNLRNLNLTQTRLAQTR